MPKTIVTKDGIELRNVPDDVSDDEIQARLNQIRDERTSGLPENSALRRAETRLLEPKKGIKESIASSLFSGYSKIGSMPERAMQGVADVLLVGPFQLASNIPAAFSDDPKYQRHADRVNQMVIQRNEEIKEKARRRGEQGFDLARLAGNALAGFAAAPASRATSLPGAMAEGAAVGGVGVGVMPREVDEDYWKQTQREALTGALLGGAIPAVQRGYSVAREFLPGGGNYRQSEMMANAAGDKYGEIMDLLADAPDDLTAAQAATPAGSATFSAMERTASSYKPGVDEFDQIFQDQAQGYRDAIRSIGRVDPDLSLSDDLAGAVSARQATSAGNYKAAFDVPVQPSRELDDILSSPMITPTIRRNAIRMAQADGVMTGTETTPENLTAVLHYIKLSIDDALNPVGAQTSAMGKNQARLLGDVQDKLVDFLKRNNPMYRRAMERHAEMSVPIDRMRVAETLDKKLTSSLGDLSEESLRQRPAAFAEAVREGERTVAQSTRRNAIRMAQADGVMTGTETTPENLTAVLHYIKLSIDDALNPVGAQTSAMGKNQARLLGDVQDKLVDFLKRNNPMYRRAMERHAEMSVPIDRMRVAETLDKKLTSSLGDLSEESLRQRPAAFAEAVREGERTVAQSTGQNRSMANILGEEMDKVNEITSALGRDQRMANLATRGAPEFRRQVSDIAGFRGPGILERGMVILNNLLSRAGVTRQVQTMRDLSRTLQDTALTREIMAMANPEAREVLRRLALTLPILEHQTGEIR